MSIAPDYDGLSRNHPANRRSWRLRNSLWLLIPIAGFGCISGAGLIYAGVRAERPAWWVAGVGYFLAGFTAMAVLGEAGEGSALEDVGAMTWLGLWIACVAHSCLINAEFLRWKAHAQFPSGHQRRSRRRTSAEMSATPGPAPSPGQPRDHYHAGPVAEVVARVGSGTPDRRAGTEFSSERFEPLDLNTATAEQFATLPGFDAARAARAVAERERRGWFGSVDEFASALGLQPHELVRIRNRLTVTPPVTEPPGPSSGRILDV